MSIVLMFASFSAFADEEQSRRECNTGVDRMKIAYAEAGRDFTEAQEDRQFDGCMERLGYKVKTENPQSADESRAQATPAVSAGTYGKAKNVVYDALAIYSIIEDIENRYSYGFFGRGSYGMHRPIIITPVRAPVRVEGYVRGCSQTVSRPNTFSGATNYGYTDRVVSKC